MSKPKAEHIGVAGGGVYPELLDEILSQKQKFAKLDRVPVDLRRFPSGERYARLCANVRRRPLMIVQTFLDSANGYTPNDALMELNLMVDAAKRASAGEITAVMPYFPYARQDRKAQGREPISAAATVVTLRALGAQRIMTIDLHSAQTQGAFNGPFDNLTAYNLIRDKLAELSGHGDQNKTVLVAPDEGRLKENRDFGNDLGLPVVFTPKSRGKGAKSGEIAREEISGDVRGKTAIIIDDMIDTAGTLVSGAEILSRNGAASVVAIATHGLFSLPHRDRPDETAYNRISDSPIEKVIVTDTVPQTRGREAWGADGSKFEILPVAPMLAEAMGRVASGESVSEMFDDRNNH